METASISGRELCYIFQSRPPQRVLQLFALHLGVFVQTRLNYKMTYYVSCYVLFMLACVCAQSRLTPCDPMDCSP